jgi:tetratricopeptide (TPR) repeat protein
MQAKAGVAEMDILLGNDEAVHVIIDGLIADFQGHPTLPQTLFRIGEEYYNKASQMENKGLKTESKSCFQNAITVWEKIIPLESHTIYTPHAYYYSATCYRRMGQYEKAIEYYQETVSRWPEYRFSPYAQYFVADCFEELVRQKAIPASDAGEMIRQTCQEVITNYPESGPVGAARNMLKRWNSVKSTNDRGATK